LSAGTATDYAFAVVYALYPYLLACVVLNTLRTCEKKLFLFIFAQITPFSGYSCFHNRNYSFFTFTRFQRAMHSLLPMMFARLSVWLRSHVHV